MSSADAGREELGAESVHRHNERRWAEMRGAWCSYHRAAAECDHRQRVEEVPGAIAKGAAETMWSTYWEVSELGWDHKRECWVDVAGIAYDAAGLCEYSRLGGGGDTYWLHAPE